MTRYFSLTALLMASLLSWCAAAQDTGVMGDVAIGLQQEGNIWNGQQVTLNLDLKTTGFSFSDIHFNLPEVSGAFLMQTDTTTIKLSEKNDGEDWQVIRYPLALYPQKSGLLMIPPIDVRFGSSAGYGSPLKEFEFRTEPLRVTVSQPPGVEEDALVVSTRSFQLEHHWEDVTDGAKSGDAFTLTVTRRAADISAMLLPPLPVFRTAGLAAYPQTPDVRDETVRGSLTGERTDSIIWVAEMAGSYEIPGIRFQWWDPGSQELKQQVVPGIKLDILPSATGRTVEGAGEISAIQPGKMLAWLIFVAVIVLGAVLWRRSGYQADAKNPIDEKSAYMAVQEACENNHAGETYRALHNWIAFQPRNSGSRAPQTTLLEFARSLNDGQLERELHELQTAIIAGHPDWRGQSMLTSIKHVRRKIKARRTARSRVHLAPLNP